MPIPNTCIGPRIDKDPPCHELASASAAGALAVNLSVSSEGTAATVETLMTSNANANGRAWMSVKLFGLHRQSRRRRPGLMFCVGRGGEEMQSCREERDGIIAGWWRIVLGEGASLWISTPGDQDVS